MDTQGSIRFTKRDGFRKQRAGRTYAESFTIWWRRTNRKPPLRPWNESRSCTRLRRKSGDVPRKSGVRSATGGVVPCWNLSSNGWKRRWGNCRENRIQLWPCAMHWHAGKHCCATVTMADSRSITTLRNGLSRISDHPINRIDELLPWNLAAVSADDQVVTA